ncbi:hypothetical protein HCN44_002024 [Aphidius gifuensis]|uniref:Major facilitator superfamily (MFS) profile domain-containing protein n=1 Tax=Aphidius gifuensis TaxID=684658 RepID=A0A835CUF9_APHGI|nr:facilitated trehalose transporter Tret1-like [Aphidius gifuensis]KAF7996392.1 hypothetical protein HCN44_002024 [Aphidius gifuensis]
MTATTEIIVRPDRNVVPRELNGSSQEKKEETTKLRQAMPQVCAVGAKNLLLLTFGSTLGFPTILIPALNEKNSDISATRSDLAWISSINLFAVPFGCLFSGPISTYLGRKRTMQLSMIPFISAWLLFYYSTTPEMLFLALSLTGLTGGLVEAPILTYVAEVTQPHLRGMLSATSTMAVILGIFSQFLTGKFITNWRVICLVNLIYPVLCFTALSLVPESPYWLTGKGRIQEAERALCWLRGWVSPSHIREELQSICNIVQNDNVHGVKLKSWEEYKKRTFIMPFILVILSFFISAFGGSATLQTYSVQIFDEMKAPLDKYTATVFLGLAELIGTAVCVTAIHFTGKRIINFASIIGTGICFFSSALYLYLIRHNLLDAHNYTWIPTTFLIGSAFLSHMGIRLLAWILAGEVFPVKVRAFATGAAASIGYIFTSIVNKSFLDMSSGLGLSGTFLFYAGVNLFGLIILYFLLPETEGRTLQEIEEHYAGIQNLKYKPKNDKLSIKEKWAASNQAISTDIDAESKL